MNPSALYRCHHVIEPLSSQSPMVIEAQRDAANVLARQRDAKEAGWCCVVESRRRSERVEDAGEMPRFEESWRQRTLRRSYELRTS